MKDLLIKEIENNLLKINSKDAAFSISKLSENDEPTQIGLRIIQNNEDNEILVMSTIIKTLTDFYLMNALDNKCDDESNDIFQYQFSVTYQDDCIVIEFLLQDEINF